MVKIIDTNILGLKAIELTKIEDDRGFFVERFNQSKFEAASIPYLFFQDNHSYSKPAVLRGLHYQHAPPQGKLVGVTRGKIWDVAVDLRPDSSTYGQHYGIELSANNAMLLWVPAGFAHGFCVLGNAGADVIYKVNAPYHSEGESGIQWNDPELAIEWPVKRPLLSPRDKSLPTFADYKKKPPKWKLDV